jgi:hypothetical protein
MIMFVISIFAAAWSKNLLKCGLLCTLCYVAVVTLMWGTHGAEAAGTGLGVGLFFSLFTVWLPVWLVAYIKVMRER